MASRDDTDGKKRGCIRNYNGGLFARWQGWNCRSPPCLMRRDSIHSSFANKQSDCAECLQPTSYTTVSAGSHRSQLNADKSAVN
ncbi:hypothetical protein M513_10842 [Trichuris suis]|uniref:Uncharacterized protein n=1 Tax=Trichuris suis TaxID=68888 RepID=A0A085LTG9_9BILA|nr:hypothetical protein M513_10842 [Trichuris suis]